MVIWMENRSPVWHQVWQPYQKKSVWHGKLKFTLVFCLIIWSCWVYTRMERLLPGIQGKHPGMQEMLWGMQGMQPGDATRDAGDAVGIPCACFLHYACMNIHISDYLASSCRPRQIRCPGLPVELGGGGGATLRVAVRDLAGYHYQ